MNRRHPDFYDPGNNPDRRDLSQAFALWAIAWELRRIADEMEGSDE